MPKNFQTWHGDRLIQKGQLSFLPKLPNPSGF
jgi:hypothetical protein